MYNYFNNYLWIRKSCNFLVSHWHSTLPVYFTNNYHSFPFLLVFMEYLLFLPSRFLLLPGDFITWSTNHQRISFDWLIYYKEVLWRFFEIQWIVYEQQVVVWVCCLIDWLNGQGKGVERTGKGSGMDREREWQLTCQGRSQVCQNFESPVSYEQATRYIQFDTPPDLTITS